MLTKKLSFVLSVIVLSAISFNVICKERSVVVKLTKIQAVKTTERSGDELYFSISQYSNKEAPQLFRVPMFPLHWLSKELASLKNVKLWEGTLGNGQSVLVVISLLEQDVEPWNSDDHIGSIQVKLLNTKGKITAQWGRPKFVDQPEIQQLNPKIPSYVMLGEGGNYKVSFKLETR